MDPAALQAACAGCWAVLSCIGANMLSTVPVDQVFRPIGAFYSVRPIVGTMSVPGCILCMLCTNHPLC